MWVCCMVFFFLTSYAWIFFSIVRHSLLSSLPIFVICIWIGWWLECLGPMLSYVFHCFGLLNLWGMILFEQWTQYLSVALLFYLLCTYIFSPNINMCLHLWSLFALGPWGIIMSHVQETCKSTRGILGISYKDN
jgi:hypothetical protein